MRIGKWNPKGLDTPAAAQEPPGVAAKGFGRKVAAKGLGAKATGAKGGGAKGVGAKKRGTARLPDSDPVPLPEQT